MTKLSFWVFITVITFSLATFYFLILMLIQHGREPNRCQMTYMKHPPKYARIETSYDKTANNYGLYVYVEGNGPQIREEYWLDGVPVLFLPGSGGSYKQVRSLASVALHMQQLSSSSLHYTYFTVDFNEEISAVDTTVLWKQGLYALNCAKFLLQHGRQRHIVIVGHSMGGIVAQYVAKRLPANKVPLLVHLAVPVERSLFVMDVDQTRFYQAANDVASTTTVLNIMGGHDDALVPFFLSHNNRSNFLNFVTTSIAGVWIPMDHLCILWCRQLIVAINLAMFDILYENKFPKNHNSRAAIIRERLTWNAAYDATRSPHCKRELHVYTKVEHVDVVNNNGQSVMSFSWKQLKMKDWLVIPLLMSNDDQILPPKYDTLVLIVENCDLANKVFGGTRSNTQTHLNDRQMSTFTVDSTVSLKENVTVLPHTTDDGGSRIMVRINVVYALRTDHNCSFTHLLLSVRRARNNTDIQIRLDYHMTSDRQLVIKSMPPYIFPSLVPYAHVMDMSHVPPNAIMVTLLLPELVHLLQSVRIYVSSTGQCIPQHRIHTNTTALASASSLHEHVAILHTPWDHQFMTDTKVLGKRGYVDLMLLRSRPLDDKDAHINSVASVDLVLAQSCAVEISVSSSTGIIWMQQWMRYYTPGLISHMVLALSVLVQSQLAGLRDAFMAMRNRAGDCVGWKALWMLVRRVSVRTLIAFAVGVSGAHLADVYEPTVYGRRVPTSDVKQMLHDGLYRDVGVLWTCLIGLCLTFILWAVLMMVLLLYQATVHRTIFTLFMRCILRLPDAVSYILMRIMCPKCLIMLLVVLFILSVSTCGALTIWLMTALYFIKIAHMSQEVKTEPLRYFLVDRVCIKLKDLLVVCGVINEEARTRLSGLSVRNSRPTCAKYTSLIYATIFHTTCLMVYLFFGILSTPSLIQWIYNRKGEGVTTDHSFVSSCVLIVLSYWMWTMDIPSAKRGVFVHGIVHSLTMMSMLIVPYGQITIFRLKYFLIWVLFSVISYHMLGSSTADGGINNTGDQISATTNGRLVTNASTSTAATTTTPMDPTTKALQVAYATSASRISKPKRL